MKFYPTKEVWIDLGVSSFTLYKRIELGYYPPLQTGGKRMIINVTDKTIPLDSDKEKINIQILEGNMSQKNSARTIYDAIKAKAKRDTEFKLIHELTADELKNVIRSGLSSGDIVIQGDIFGVEEQLSKEIMLSNRFKNQAI